MLLHLMSLISNPKKCTWCSSKGFLDSWLKIRALKRLRKLPICKDIVHRDYLSITSNCFKGKSSADYICVMHHLPW